MKALAYVWRGRVVNSVPFIITCICVIVRLMFSVNETDTLENSLTLFIFVIFPPAIWFFIQRTQSYFSSMFLRVRKQTKISNYLIHTLIDYGLGISYACFIIGINVLLYMEIAFNTASLLLLWKTCSSYVMMIAIYHFLLIYKRDLRIAFVLSYAISVISHFSDTLFFLKMRMMNLDILLSIVYFAISTVLTAVIAWKVNKEGDLYELYS